MNFSLTIFGLLAILWSVQGSPALDSYQPKHFNSIDSTSTVGSGCRTGKSEVDLFGVSACSSAKPLKPGSVLQRAKALCSPGWEICTSRSSSMLKVSWDKSPEGCFAFQFGKKNKAAGYGRDCHMNLYYHGVLCCPKHEEFSPKKLLLKQKWHSIKSNEHFPF